MNAGVDVVTGKPGPSLGHWVAWYQLIRSRKPNRTRLRFCAGACAFIAVPVEGRLDWITASGSGRVAEGLAFGPRSAWVDLGYHGGSTLFLINLELGGLARLAGRAAHAAVDGFAPLRYLGLGDLDRAAGFAMDGRFDAARLSAAGSAGLSLAAAACFGAADQFLHGRLSAAEEADKAGLRMAARLYGAEPPARIAEAAAALDVTEARLDRGLRAVLGLPPKAFMGISRAKRFYEHLIERKPARRGAWLAQEYGYYDQSHAVHDLVARTGYSPSALADIFLPKGDGEVWYGHHGTAR